MIGDEVSCAFSLFYNFLVSLFNICFICIIMSFVLYTNIDLKLRNKSHGPMHYTIGVTCVYYGHVFYTLL